MKSKDLRPERDKTDESLAVERARTDHALTEKAEESERKADVIVERARTEADLVLTNARALADRRLGEAGNHEPARGAIDAERKREDGVVERERALADESLERERARELARFLPMERDKTDLFLLTERARSDDALANRDDFLGMVSHDLRDLLQVVIGSAQAMASDASDDDRGKRTLTGAARIQRSAGRMTRLIGDLVDVASIDAGKLAVAPRIGDAAALVQEAIETWTPPAATKGIMVEPAAGAPIAGPVSANIDNGRVLQVLGNLIANAIKFSARDSKIRVGVENIGNEVRFSVEDRGPGIAEDKLEAIFERFWQVTGNDRRGLGLGLYISRCLVEAHGGSIWAESELGAGSTFYFTVPAGP